MRTFPRIHFSYTAFTLIGTMALATSTASAADIFMRGVNGEPPVHDRVAGAFLDAGFYVGLRGGFTVADDTEFGVTGGTVSNIYDGASPIGGLFAGYELRMHSLVSGRVEAEVGYASLDVDDHFLGATALLQPTGTTTAFTGTVSGYLDAHLGAFRPFIGAGVGMAIVDFDEHGAPIQGTVMDTDDTSFLWQVSAGLGYDITPNLTVEGMVRYQSIMDVELVSTDDVASETDLTSTHGLLGIRYRF